MSVSTGFTLVELMIVVAIIGVLAAIALPVYQDYLARSQVAEGLMGAGQMKSAISEYHAAQGTFPPAGRYDAAGGRYTDTLTHDAIGIITATMRNSAPVSQLVRNFQFRLYPECDSERAVANWRCEPAGAAGLKYLSSGCQGSPSGVSAAACMP